MPYTSVMFRWLELLQLRLQIMQLNRQLEPKYTAQ